MAIYGAGSNWGGKEIRQTLFDNNNYLIGWDIANAEDLYTLISSIRVGDIIYLKSNRPGSLNLRIKGIGFVTHSLMQSLFETETDLSSRRTNFELPVNWVYRNEYTISIPPDTGKLTNIRAATLYEEYMPFVQDNILKTIFGMIN
ncbi:hypothetical protein [Roseivirga pacifica]|uniref:hypothetical protein n=1 Tax=Roseivirga pacifica TaxID=1267423 RepID=UPI00227A94E6|nr:hypothetical protein [Roseivirga pacifica]